MNHLCHFQMIPKSSPAKTYGTKSCAKSSEISIVKKHLLCTCDFSLGKKYNLHVLSMTLNYKCFKQGSKVKHCGIGTSTVCLYIFVNLFFLVHSSSAYQLLFWFDFLHCKCDVRVRTPRAHKAVSRICYCCYDVNVMNESNVLRTPGQLQ